MRLRSCLVVFVVLASLSGFAASSADRLKNSYRFERDQWIYVHLEGSPSDIGFQHGSLLADEIKGALLAMKTRTLHDTHRDWSFFRKTSQDML